MRLAPGDYLGPYEILAPLGVGGMGEVYRARDHRLGREVAVKILSGVGTISDKRRRRFEREARAIAALDHPNLLTVFDVGTTRGIDYIVTELLRGESLRARLDRVQTLPATEVVRVAQALASGLAAAHARDIVHRDIKPANVFLTEDDRIKILDFGIARIAEGATDQSETDISDQTAPGMLLGTAPYMAPEQVREEPVLPQTDLFALGAVMHECLSGSSPFKREKPAATFAAVLGETAPPLAGVPDELAQLIDRCLAKRAADRPGSAAEVADALAHLATVSSTDMEVRRLAPVSVAVLPFVDLSQAADQEYFCDGIAEEILHALSKLSGVRVAARSSSFQFRGGKHDARAIARRLDVGHILEGSVRRAGERLRISVQLVDATTGRTVWSERYDRDAGDVFAIQDEIASSAATTLSVVMTDEARRAWRRRGTQDLAAYEAYLQGRQLVLRHTATGQDNAIAAYGRAVDLDPSFAGAWAALADAHALRFTWFGNAPEDVTKADAASERAVALDPQSPEAHTARAEALAIGGHLDEAVAEFEQALALAPDMYDALYNFARIRFEQGKDRDAAELFERAARARPDEYQALCLAIMAYTRLGNLDRQVDCARRATARVERRLAIAPRDVRALYLGAGAHIVLGDRDRALTMARRAHELDPNDPYALYNVACVLARLGDTEEALAAVERAVDAGFGVGRRAWFERDPDFDSIRATARFQAVLDRL